MKKLRVILVEQGLPNVEALAEVCKITERLKLSDDLANAIARQQPDLLVLDVRTPAPAFLTALKAIQSENPLPIVIFSQDDTQDTIELAVGSGVSAYVVDSLQCPRLLPILNTAMARFRHLRGLETELSRTREQLENRKHIERAKGIIMRQRNIGEDDAYRLLRKTAMDKNQPLVEVANAIVAAAELLSV